MKGRNQSFDLAEGEHLNRPPNRPVLEIVEGETPRDAYLWIGNNGERDRACFATLGGRERLVKLARGILRAVGEVA
jgi:hypothetical protein